MSSRGSAYEEHSQDVSAATQKKDKKSECFCCRIRVNPNNSQLAYFPFSSLHKPSQESCYSG